MEYIDGTAEPQIMKRGLIAALPRRFPPSTRFVHPGHKRSATYHVVAPQNAGAGKAGYFLNFIAAFSAPEMYPFR